jgi:hypothetical protein
LDGNIKELSLYSKSNTMSKTKQSVVLDIISEKLTNLLDEMSETEFVELVGDRIYDEVGETLDDEEITELIGDKVSPLLFKIGQWLVENQNK